ncbi:MAG: Dna2/Cas4 domain-containing protein [Deltaproteobacteria bacterium]|nr:Dna2/Cas4 domain-containing protein [Deltaproteobacteria bacterium]
MIEQALRDFFGTLVEVSSLDTDLLLFAMLVAVCIITFDSLQIIATRKRREAGLEKKSITLGLDGSKMLPVKNYVSESQGLAGRPDAIIIENGFIIPVERKPLARKLRDRYVAQLLVYMRLIEEVEGKKPPYGYLILGSNCRRVKITNTDNRQAWLQKMIDEMHEILDGAQAMATPRVSKCKRCDVSSACSFKAEEASEQLVKVGQR